MKKYLSIIILVLSLATACNDEAFLNREPRNILLEEQVFSDPELIVSVLADLYNRQADYIHINAWWEIANFDEGFGSFGPDYWRHQFVEYPYGWWFYWDYEYVRAINVFIQKIQEAADELDEEDKNQFLAEARVLRAAVYFEMVKRMGGVPLLTEPLTYDFSGDPTYLQHPRAKEYEVYDFIISELEAAKNDLPDDITIKSRATKGLALAMKSRAALYAASIARYGAQRTPSVTLTGEEVGIPESKAVNYYQIALAAAQEVTGYSLYQRNPDLQDNFASLFIDKNDNPEVIFVRDYKLKSDVTNHWTIDHSPLTSAEEQQGGRLNPSLNLVQSFEKLDNTFAPFEIRDVNTDDFIYYDNPGDLFEGRDARLGGTVLYPGTSFKDKPVDIWAGYILGDGSKVSGSVPNAQKELVEGGVEVQVVGKDGPVDGYEFTAQTGFYVRKYLDPAAGSGQIGTQSEVWFIRYRYAEVLLNAAEAAFELDDKPLAATYLNQVRERAGFTIPLTEGDITFDRIVNERKVEFAFEGHNLWDMKRWRLAHIVWDGSNPGLTTTPGDAEAVSTRVYALWPWKIYDPGNPNDGKWVFEQRELGKVTASHRFQLGNYYSQISNEVLNNNPKIVRNPLQ